MTGEVDEYASLKDKVVSETVSSGIVDWLKKTFAASSTLSAFLDQLAA